MYDFHYSLIKKHFDAELLFTDTDSLNYETKSEDVYEEFFKHKHLFDFSNYLKDSKIFDETNKNVIGKIKDESEGKIMDAFVGLNSKICSIKKIDGNESNTTIGVNIATGFNEFKNTLLDRKIIRHKMKKIQSRKQLLPLLFSFCLILFCWLMFACECFLCVRNFFVKRNKQA